MSVMSINKFCFGLVVFWVAFASANAQNRGNTNLKKDSLLNNITNLNKRIKDASSNKNISTGFSAPLKIDTAYANQLNDATFGPQRDNQGLLILENNWTPFSENTTFRDTVILDPVFLPVIFDGKILPDNLDFLPVKSDSTEEFHLIPKESTFASELDRVQHIREMRKYYFMNNPQKVRVSTSDFVDSEKLKEASVVEKKNVFKELLTTDDAISISKPEVEKIQIKPVYWLKNGDHKLQLSFNTYSKQWSGDNNFDLFSHQKFNVNYKKNKIRFDNLIEWRLQLKQITSIDKDKDENKNKDKVNVIEDYLRTYSIFKLEAFKKWSYSANLEMKTPIFSKKTTDVNRTLQRAFLTPFELNTGIGMSYSTETKSNKDKYRILKLSADISALSINYKYASHDSISVTSLGIKEGRKSQTDFGSTFNVNLSYAHNRFAKYTSRIKYFTNYKKAYAEWENSFDLALNRFFSTTLYLYVKFDDSVVPEKRNNDDTWAYFNYNQMVRFGLTYTW